MKRWIALSVSLTFLSGCSGIGGPGNRLLPAAPSNRGLPATFSDRAATRSGAAATVAFKLFPARIAREARSIGIAVNGGTTQIFDASPASANCKPSAAGDLCTFPVSARVGVETFEISAYLLPRARGSMLARGSAVVLVRKKDPEIRLGPVVASIEARGRDSLRSAIGAAHPGETIVFFVPKRSKIVLDEVLSLPANVAIAGPGRDGVTLSGNDKHQIFAIPKGITATISGLTLTHGNATRTTSNQPGGAIANHGTLTLVDDAVTYSTSSVGSGMRTQASRRKDPLGRLHPRLCSSQTLSEGGAIYNNGIMSILGTTFFSDSEISNPAGCVFGAGGAIFNDGLGRLTVVGSDFDENAAYYGGAVYNAQSASEAFEGDTFSHNEGCTASTGCPVSGCSGTGCASSPAGYGGAIYDLGGPVCDPAGCGPEFQSDTFSKNVAGGVASGSLGRGGAIYVSSRTVGTIVDSTFTDNVAGGGSDNCSSGEGGAIFEDIGDLSGNLAADNDSFTGNKAGGDDYGEGGAVYTSVGVHFASQGDTFSSNAAFSTGGTCGHGWAFGGALQAGSAAIQQATFSNNAATAAALALGGAVSCGDTFVGSSFTSNVAEVTGGGYSAGSGTAYGGAIWVGYGPFLCHNNFSVTLTKDTFTGNVASSIGPGDVSAYGGAALFEMSQGTQLKLNGNTFTSNIAGALGGRTGLAYGGALEILGGTCTSNGDAFKSNKVVGLTRAYGGAADVNCGSFALRTDLFQLNLAGSPAAYGGALSIDAAGASISDSTFEQNRAGTGTLSGPQVGYGGAIYAGGGTTISNSVIRDGSALTAGGGLYTDADDANNTVSGTTFTGNKVLFPALYGGGGGVYVNSTTTISNSTISGNTVTVPASIVNLFDGGGGVYNNGGLALIGTTISANTVKGVAPGAGGGGIFNNDTLGAVNSTLTGNSATVDRGGGLQNVGDAHLTNLTLYQNAAGIGGNLYNVGTVLLTNTIAGGGTAAIGPDVDNPGKLASNDYNLIQTAVAGYPPFGSTTHDLQANPKLLPLANNGGPTMTDSDQAKSPGTAYIPFSGGNCGNAAGLTVDQRSYTRGANGKCDVGAYEYAGVATGMMQIRVTPVHGTGRHRQLHPRPQLKLKRRWQ